VFKEFHFFKKNLEKHVGYRTIRQAAENPSLREFFKIHTFLVVLFIFFQPILGTLPDILSGGHFDFFINL